MLNPELVGLGILDSFVFGIPIVTTDCGLHSPEISYLKNNANGFITRNNLNDYMQCCVNLLQDADRLKALSVNCFTISKEYMPSPVI